jgi:hypothetical protein
MKHGIYLSLISMLSISAALAGFSERKLETAKASAAKSGKSIAFVFYQDYWNPNCPTCLRTVGANNGAIKKAIPRTSAVVIEIEKGDKDMDKLPSVVSASGKLPRIVVTDAAGGKVIAEQQGAPDRDAAKAFEKKVKDATGK